jgi:hypothetical protein
MIYFPGLLQVYPIARLLRSIDLFDIVEFPSLVVKRLLGAIEAEDHEKPLVGDCREPALALTG